MNSTYRFRIVTDSVHGVTAVATKRVRGSVYRKHLSAKQIVRVLNRLAKEGKLP